MELVYLWVEDYKNIKKQGFNFSPKFECKYDEETNELKIDEKEHLENFFGENINLTAIVGENGSGKSSICEIMATYSYEEFHDQKTFLVFFNDENFLFKQGFTKGKLTFTVKNNTLYENDNKNKSRTIDLVYFSNDIASIFNNPNFAYRLKDYHHLDAYYEYKKSLMPNNKFITTKEKKDKFEIFNKRLQELLKEDDNILSYIQSQFIFDSFKRELHFYEIGAYIVSNQDIINLLKKEKLKGNTIFTDSIDLTERLLKLLILFRLTSFSNNKTEGIINLIKKEFNTPNFTISNCLNIFKEISKYDKKEVIYTEENIKNILDSYEYFKDEVWVEKEINNISNNFETSNELLNILLKEINRTNYFNSKNSDYNYFSLSSGEREYISIFVAFIHHLKRVKKNNSGSDNEFIFLFDEIDLGLHPNWQKSLVKDLIHFAKKFINKNIQLIITSHSPFILSDLPKENIIFLENGKQKHPFKNNQTFGANIHTLLSHGFFMENGLMGEFAKNKIDEVIKYLKPNEESIIQNDKEAKSIIDIIGEPILKNTLQTMYDDKVYKDESKLDTLKRKQKEIEKAIEQEKLKNEGDESDEKS